VKIRRIRGWLALCAAIALIPWTVYLGLTLPQSYSAQHWQATWVGFDVLLLMFMCATAVLGFHPSPLADAVRVHDGSAARVRRLV
jgi:hypothetical protein